MRKECFTLHESKFVALMASISGHSSEVVKLYLFVL